MFLNLLANILIIMNPMRKATEVMEVMEGREGREAQELTMNTMNTTIPRVAPPRTPLIPPILLQTRPSLLLHQHDLRKRMVALT